MIKPKRMGLFSTDTAAALGSHLAKVHAHAAPSAFGFGTTCEACRRQFWFAARLRGHLKRAHRCARVLSGGPLGSRSGARGACGRLL